MSITFLIHFVSLPLILPVPVLTLSTTCLHSEERKEREIFAGLNEEEVDNDMMDSSHGVLLDEMPLPRMFIPGNIVHIYTHRGGKWLIQIIVYNSPDEFSHHSIVVFYKDIRLHKCLERFVSYGV